MKFRDSIALVVVFYTTLLFSAPAHAQLSQQGPKLVGTAKFQGMSVALSGDGNTAIVGGGEPEVWTRSGGFWTRQSTKLVGSDAVGDAGKGTSVALSADGNTAIVGVPTDNGGDDNGVGGAWIWTRSGGVWSQQSTKLVGSDAVSGALGIHQGASVALSADGNTAIVGGYGDNSGAGAAWIWTRSGGVWSQQRAKLVGSNAVGNARQGSSVALSADSNTAIVGGVYDNGGRYGKGAAWIWTRNVGVWTQQSTKLVGGGSVGYSLQGASVALSEDGNTALVGGPGDGSTYEDGFGAAWVWTRSGGVWTQQGSKLVVYWDTGYQGGSVSLSADGNVAIVGAPYRQGPGPDPDPSYGLVTGAAWIWTRSAGVWAQQSTRLVGADGTLASQGFSVALSGDGTTAIIGGPSDNDGVGAAWIFAAEAVPPRRRGVRH